MGLGVRWSRVGGHSLSFLKMLTAAIAACAVQERAQMFLSGLPRNLR